MKLRGRDKAQPVEAVAGTDADDERLAGVLVAARLVEPYQLDAARAARDIGTVAEKLVAAGTVGEEAIARTLADHYGCVLLDFRDVEPAPDALALLSPEQARTLRALPLAVDDEAVTVAVLDPAPERIETVAAVIGRQVVAAVATARDLDRALATAYRATRDVSS